jgi:hypothetical protein
MFRMTNVLKIVKEQLHVEVSWRNGIPDTTLKLSVVPIFHGLQEESVF